MSKRLCEKFLSIDTETLVAFTFLFIIEMIIPIGIGFITLFDEEINNFWNGFIFCHTLLCSIFISVFIIFKILNITEKIIKSLKKQCSKKHGLYYNDHSDF